MTLHLDFEGFCYPSWWNGAYADPASARSLDDMVQTRANAIELNVEYFVDNFRSNAIYADPGGTDSLANLGKAIDDSHDRGLTVLVKPLVDSKDDVWRGQFQPAGMAPPGQPPGSGHRSGRSPGIAVPRVPPSAPGRSAHCPASTRCAGTRQPVPCQPRP